MCAPSSILLTSSNTNTYVFVNVHATTILLGKNKSFINIYLVSQIQVLQKIDGASVNLT
jgi:hypothetical protein